MLALGASSAAAHEVKASDDVAATFHIEPNHNPKAEQPAQAWFALTQKGGKPIPLEQCNCQLAVYTEPHTEGSKPLLKPVLKVASVGQGIPGAEIIFPKSGAYTLELSGTPRAGAAFEPFKLPYTVMVGAGTPLSQAASSPQLEPASKLTHPSQPSTQWQLPTAIGVILVGVIGAVVWASRSKQ